MTGLGLAPWVLAGGFGACDFDAGPCAEPHESPGCNEVACCNAICELDPFCCDVTWDDTCVAQYEDVCEEIPCPGEGACDIVHVEPGCDDELCCFFVCTFDAFCCFGTWDTACVGEAAIFCAAEPCTIEIPPGAILEEEPCVERTNDGCNLNEPAFVSIACGETHAGTCGNAPPRDSDWFRLEVGAPQQLTWTVTAEFPAQLLAVRGACDGALEVVAESNGLDCGEAALEFCAEPGSYYLFVSTGTSWGNVLEGIPCLDDPDAEPGFYGNTYVASLDCASCGPAADLDGDGDVDGADLGILLGSWGECPGCPADLDGDGTVGGADLGLLLGSWTG